MDSVPKLSIVILSYNVRELLLNCLASLDKARSKSDSWEIIVVDNASSDGSAEAVKKHYPKVKLIRSDKNTGYSAGNNLGVKQATGDYVLFLNDDTLIEGRAIQSCLDYIHSHPEVGAITCRIELPDGRLDYSSHRGLPTPWNSLTYFTGLARAFPQSKLFAGYTATYQDLNTTHAIDCATGAFLMVRREAGEQIGWWDEDYFWNGEDIEFCFQLRSHNWQIVFYPQEKIIHFKGASSGFYTHGKTTVSQATKLATAKSATKAMRIFYGKHYKQGVVGGLVWLGIQFLEALRLLKLRLGLKYA